MSGAIWCPGSNCSTPHMARRLENKTCREEGKIRVVVHARAANLSCLKSYLPILSEKLKYPTNSFIRSASLEKASACCQVSNLGTVSAFQER